MIDSRTVMVVLALLGDGAYALKPSPDTARG
jgi:hypothetical protein